MTEALEKAARTLEWSGTEDQQHRARMKACRSRRKTYPDDDCDRDGSCTECEYDMAEALETAASRKRCAAALDALQPKQMEQSAVDGEVS